MANRASTTDDLRVKISSARSDVCFFCGVGGGGRSCDSHARDAEDTHGARRKMVVMGGDAPVRRPIHG
ncbi:hypothetical protein ACQJBY_044371 [Aegilops geniculata]